MMVFRDTSNKMRAARLSGQQFEVLIEFMQEHPHFAVGRASGGPYTKEEHDQLWKSLAAILNETQGPVKPVSKWQKCWVDLKSNARSRANKWRAKFSGDPPELPGTVFTPWDERVLRVLNGISCINGNNDSSPLQLVEVGFSEKVGHVKTNGASSNSQKQSTRSALPTSVYECHDDGTQYDSSSGSQHYNDTDPLHKTNNKDCNVEVKSEEEEWQEVENRICDEDYSLDSMTARDELDSRAMRYLPTHYALPNADKSGDLPDGSNSVKSNKRKLEDHNFSMAVENSLERLSKKICGTLDRIATAAEEANTLQQGMVNAMNRLATTFEELLPAVAKVLSKN
ncbi:Phosphopentomutase [Frankliniella fusca]|uniref:Regulatory protein zeste n=1 Tax=Frankliniella fusca TaxID=407009 RepID=A0AAE1GZT6_9NEOP|nr:Phosphopentomutase [Frankliniella fusca]